MHLYFNPSIERKIFPVKNFHFLQTMVCRWVKSRWVKFRWTDTLMHVLNLLSYCSIFLVILVPVIIFIFSPSTTNHASSDDFFPRYDFYQYTYVYIAQLHYGASRVHKHPKASLLHAVFTLRVISQRANDAYNQWHLYEERDKPANSVSGDMKGERAEAGRKVTKRCRGERLQSVAD